MAGRINKCGLLFTAQLQLSSYRDCGDFAVTKLEGEDLILGMPWLARIDPLILCKKRTWFAREFHYYTKLYQIADRLLSFAIAGFNSTI